MHVIARIAALLFLVSCVATPPPPSPAVSRGDAEPYIRGTITNVTESGVMIEEKPDERSGSAKAMMRIVDATQIVSSDGRVLGRADLRNGQTVSAWTTGQVMESYPVQATASRIVVHAAR